MTKISISYENFDFWRKFLFFAFFDKNLDFWKNFDFWQKFRFLTKISISYANFDFWRKFLFFVKNSDFWKNVDFWKKFRFLTKISISFENFCFWFFRQKLRLWKNFHFIVFDFLTKIELFWKNFEFRQKLRLWKNFDFLVFDFFDKSWDFWKEFRISTKILIFWQNWDFWQNSPLTILVGRRIRLKFSEYKFSPLFPVKFNQRKIRQNRRRCRLKSCRIRFF